MLAALLVACFSITIAAQPARAALLTTSDLGQEGARERVNAALERADVRAGLEAQGIDPAEARARVDALSDAEIRDMAGRLDALPAGGFFVLLIVALLAMLIGVLLGMSAADGDSRRSDHLD